MYIRVNRTPNSPRRSIQIVQSVRQGQQVRQQIVRYVGVAADEQEEQQLKDLAYDIIATITRQREQAWAQPALFARLPSDTPAPRTTKTLGRRARKTLDTLVAPSQVTLEEIVEEKRIVEGVHEVAGAMFDELYHGLFPRPRTYQLVRDVVLSRLAYPGSSKRKIQASLARHFDKSYSLERIYSMMDQVFPKISQIKQRTFARTQALFPQQVDVILFDVTTLYFEPIQVDELRQYGYSKDHRFSTTQVVLALATNQVGLPVGYELFEGHQAEVSTLAAAIDSWKTLFRIESVCFVGDRAMFSKSNIALLESLQYHYVIAAKLKSLPRALQAQILDDSRYTPTVIHHELAWLGEFEYEGQRLITSYKPSRARKDVNDRERVVEKVKKTLGNKARHPQTLITNRGVKKLVTVNEQATVALDEAKIQQAAHWDGLKGLLTNIRDEAPGALLARYAQLWMIEDSFRVNKHTLAMRPIFHWSPPRIHAHIALCYMTFSVLRHLQYRVNLTQKISVDTLLKELVNVQASIYVHKQTQDRYRVPGAYSNEARKIYKALGLERSLDVTVYSV